jgi:hypothetical protein
VLPEFPDILSEFVDVTYDAATDVLTASGLSIQIAIDAVTTRSILNGTFNIAIVTDGVSATGTAGDDLSIAGDFDLTGDGIADVSGTLLTGEIAEFGSSVSAPGLFEFVFTVTGGIFAGPIPFFALPQAGVILGADGGSTYNGSFDVSFNNTGGVAGAGTGNADTAPVPEPGTLLLLGSGIAGLVGFGRRERR